MSRSAGNLYHPLNRYAEPIFRGFSWPCFFFGFLWFAVKGMWGWAIVGLILAFSTFGLSWFVFPFLANEMYTKSLLKQGYLGEERVAAPANAPAARVA